MSEFAYTVILCSTLATNLLVALYVLFRHPGNIVHQSFFAMVFGIVAWGCGLQLLKYTSDFMPWNAVVLFGGVAVIAGLYVFSKVFPHGNVPRGTFWATLVPMAVFCFLIPTHLIIQDAEVIGGFVRPVNGVLFPAFALASAAYIISSLVLLRRTYWLSSVPERRRLKYFFLGLGLFITTALIADMILPSLGYFALNILGPLSSIVLVFSTAYAIVRHRVMDVRVVLQRGIIYTILLSLLVGTYLLCVIIASALFHAVGEKAVFIGAGAAVVLGALGVQHLERYFQKLTDRWFFKDRYDYGEALHRLSRILNATISQHVIIERSEEALRKIFKAEGVSILLGTIVPPRLMGPSSGQAEVCVPLVFEDERIGMLMLGKKRSGDDYSAEDVRLIETFSYQAAVALEKARLYEEVRDYSRTLERLVDERTKTIHDLLEDQKQSMFDISHSLQTPLAVLTNQIELLEETSADPGILSVCRHSIRSVSQFIRRLLHLVTLESKYGQERIEPINISAILQDDVEYFATMAEAEGISFVSSFEPGLAINGNSELIDELVMNLVTNAIKYSGPKDTERVVGMSLVREGERVVLQVRDNGIGIPERDHEAIFKRFYRARQRDTSAQGSGLGLAICKRIADMHGATISLESAAGQGSTFSVSFPLIKRSA